MRQSDKRLCYVLHSVRPSVRPSVSLSVWPSDESHISFKRMILSRIVYSSAKTATALVEVTGAVW